MTVIRLTRMGRKKRAFYRIVVTDSRKRRDGGWIETIGYYNPVSKEKDMKIDEERLKLLVKSWCSNVPNSKKNLREKIVSNGKRFYS